MLETVSMSSEGSAATCVTPWVTWCPSPVSPRQLLVDHAERLVRVRVVRRQSDHLAQKLDGGGEVVRRVRQVGVAELPPRLTLHLSLPRLTGPTVRPTLKPTPARASSASPSSDAAIGQGGPLHFVRAFDSPLDSRSAASVRA